MGQVMDNLKLMKNVRDLESPQTLLELIAGMEQHMALYQSGIQEIRTKLEILQRDARFGEGHNPIDSIKSRIKSPMSIIEKMYRKGFPISLDSMRANLNDVAGIRVICPFIEDIYTVAQMLTRQDDLVVIKEKDYIKNPKPNGLPQLPSGAAGSGLSLRPKRDGAGGSAAANHRDGLLGQPGASNPLQNQLRGAGQRG